MFGNQAKTKTNSLKYENYLRENKKNLMKMFLSEWFKKETSFKLK